MDNVFGVLFSIFRGSSGHGDWVIACLQGAWPKLIGERLAAVCTPASFDGSTLVISTKDRQWQEAVLGISPALTEKLQISTDGIIKKIKVIEDLEGKYKPKD